MKTCFVSFFYFLENSELLTTPGPHSIWQQMAGVWETETPGLPQGLSYFLVSPLSYLNDFIYLG